MGLFPSDRDLTRPPERVELRVDATAVGARIEGFEERLDLFLARRLPWRSRASVQRLIKDGWISIDPNTPESPEGSGAFATETRPGRRLRHASRVEIKIPPGERLPPAVRTDAPLEVLWEDGVALAVAKPAGLPVHPSGRHVSDTLIQRVHAHRRAEIERAGVAPRLCHRLDRETSGIVLIATDQRAHRRIMRQFERRQVEKEYLAIVHGEVGEEHGSIDLPLGPARASRVGLKIAVAADGLPSKTSWSIERRIGDHTLLRCRLHTGRQHQLRVHLAAIGHPIVGDKLYAHDEAIFQRSIDGRLTGEDRRLLVLDRHALHHTRLVFRSPAGDDPVEITCPLPPDLVSFLSSPTG
ncbi:MAG: RluA family pseudouridine synthase [Planctomycetota bacterium]|nr:RluA family pseudouridine synthase [Planctomycetota bacterium]MDP6762054.1 RluA family pseudouridine synthase [Planctomycetota bacterium]MDP6989153.1 RluA family pseudouridine synthase [Planctomycetota bacterium]